MRKPPIVKQARRPVTPCLGVGGLPEEYRRTLTLTLKPRLSDNMDKVSQVKPAGAS